MKYSFVIPCYRSEKTIQPVVHELLAEINNNKIEDYEIILVNDGSPDNVWDVICDLNTQNKNILGICLAKNFGQHAALMAGYSRCTGDIVVSLDDDGQAPLDELSKLLEKFNQGYDVVYAYYEEIQQTWFRKFGTKVNAQMNKSLLGSPKDFRVSSFSVFAKFIVDEVIKYDHAYPYLAGLILRVTRNIGYVQTKHRKRVIGQSGYSFLGLLSMWMNGFTAFSVKPLEMGVWVGILFALAGFLGVVVTVIRKLYNPDILVGWSSLISLVLILGGIILLMLGLIGEYIGRIYICINKAPQYVVREERGRNRISGFTECKGEYNEKSSNFTV